MQGMARLAPTDDGPFVPHTEYVSFLDVCCAKLLQLSAAGTDKQAQGCAGEGLKPEGLSPQEGVRVLSDHAQNVPFGEYHLRAIATAR